MKKGRFIPLILYILVLLLIFSWAGSLFGYGMSNISYSQVVELFQK